MKAVSLRPEWAMPVMLGLKTVECRTWRTEHRGDLLICSSARPCPGAVAGKALCVVTLDDIEPFEARHLWDAYMDDCPRGSWAWKLSGLRWVEPFDVKGRLNLYEVDDARIRTLPDMGRETFEKWFMPHVHMGRDPREARKVLALAMADAGI